jgi:hypothetical protein
MALISRQVGRTVGGTGSGPAATPKALPVAWLAVGATELRDAGDTSTEAKVMSAPNRARASRMVACLADSAPAEDPA